MKNQPTEKTKKIIIRKKTGKIIDSKNLQKMPKKDRDPEAKELLKVLKKNYFVIFNSEAPKPLDTRIVQMIRKHHPEFSWNTIRYFLGSWCYRKKYHEAVVNFGKRFDLKGNETQDVLDDQMKFSQNILAELKRKEEK